MNAQVKEKCVLLVLTGSETRPAGPPSALAASVVSSSASNKMRKCVLSSPAVKWSVYCQSITGNREPLVLKRPEFFILSLTKSATGWASGTR